MLRIVMRDRRIGILLRTEHYVNGGKNNWFGLLSFLTKTITSNHYH